MINISNLKNIKPDQYRKADFTSYTNRRNGWNGHAIIFNTNLEEINESEKIFVFDSTNGSIKILRDGFVLKFELWWKGIHK